MPIALLLIGLVIVVAGARGRSADLLKLVEDDFLSSQGYIPWAISILAVGAVGYIPRAKPISDAFLVLIVVVLILSNKGVFASFQSAVSGIGGQTLAGSTAGSAGSAGSGLPASVTSVMSGLASQFGTVQAGGTAASSNATAAGNGSASSLGGGTLQGIYNSAGQWVGDTTGGASSLGAGETLGAAP